MAAKKKPAPSSKKKLPTALVENARKARKLAAARAHTRALAALERFRSARDAASMAWWQMGFALQELADPAVLAALGRADLAELCARDLDIHVATARRMLGVMKRVTSDLAAEVTLHRAEALIELADATPEDDTPEQLLDATLTLPVTRGTLVVRSASTEALHDAAKEYREHQRAQGDAQGRGLTTKPTDRKLLRSLQAAAKDDPALASARFKLVASRDPDGAWLEVRVRAKDAAALAKIARAARKASVDD